MRLSIPVYVRQHRPEGSPAPLFLARPLFLPRPHRNGTVLNRVLTNLGGDLRQLLDALARRAHQRELADWSFDPPAERAELDATVALRRRTVRAKVLAVAFRSGSATLGFFPELPTVWFDVPAGRSLEGRARDVLTEHLLKLEKEEEEGDGTFDPELLLGGRVVGTLLTAVEVDVQVRPKLPKPDERPMFSLGAAEAADGAEELYKVGRSLDALYPDDLDPAVLREAEVAELARRLADPDRRPVLLLGPRGVGKTAVVHETVRRRVREAQQAGAPPKHGVWLVSPQRLVSGMSFVGQWEDRLLAILKEVAKRDDVLYFDDLLGLYHAGQTNRSSLSAADVLRPVLERREFRVLAEMTPEAHRVLRERDRAMADQFDVLPLREPTEVDARRVLVTVQRHLEDRHRCAFALDALPAVVDLQRRYVRDVAMPGKAAELLRRLAGGHAKQTVARDEVLAAFRSYSGLTTEFLDATARLRRRDVVAALGRRVVSQPAAVAAMADAVCVAKARLNDTSRPVATLLFLGPTGVGKTECAKALAGYLFGAGGDHPGPQDGDRGEEGESDAPARDGSGSAKSAARGFANRGPSGRGPGVPSGSTRESASGKTSRDRARSEGDSARPSHDNSPAPSHRTPGEDRLLRFDMNEYVDPAAAARLTGTFGDPDGLLTSAVRRQPFAVVLLDEIEKAHPAVFDLLLAVLGEGRLTDARGRTADFTNTIIVMTSNLGVREAGASFGLRSTGASDAAAHDVYRSAAERFFRPEFFNRIDRVVPFDRLDRQDVADIARRLMDDLLRRDGLTGRRCVLRVHPDALRRVIDAGYHPQLGARALKREVEKRVAAPVARRLAVMPPGEPTVIDVLPLAEVAGTGAIAAVDDGALVVRVTPIRPADPLPPTRPALDDPAWADPGERIDLLDDLLDAADAALARLEASVEVLAPAGGITQGRMSADHFAYLAVREQARTTAAAIERLDRAVEAAAKPPSKLARKGGKPTTSSGPLRTPLRRISGISAAWRQLLAVRALPDEATAAGNSSAPASDDEHLPRLRELAAELLDDLALLRAMAEAATATGVDAPPDAAALPTDAAASRHRVLLVLRSESAGGPLATMADLYPTAFARQHGAHVAEVESSAGPVDPRRAGRRLPRTARALVVDFPGAAALLAGEVGTHLHLGGGGAVAGRRDHGRDLEPVEVLVIPFPAAADPVMAALDALEQAAAGDATAEPIPAATADARGGRVVRAYCRGGPTLDLRAGLAADEPLAGEALRRIMLAGLALPQELSADGA